MLFSLLPGSARLWLLGGTTQPKRLLPGDKTDFELELEAKGDLNALQQYRYERYYFLIKNANPDESPELLGVETSIRETCQEEARMNEKLLHAMTENGSGDDLQIQDIKKKLDALNQRYWLAERDWWAYRSGFPEGALTRGFDLWRSHPRWYMHRVLVEDCVGRGGCCGRECGCCIHREKGSARKHGVGHCTVECGCCIKSRGFELSKEQKDTISRLFDVSADCKDQYFYRMVRASLWGLLDGSYDSPFDLIQDPARTDHKVPPSTVIPYQLSSRSAYLSEDETDQSTSTETIP